MRRRISMQAEQWPQVAPDGPVIRINWLRVAFAGLLVATVTILVTLGFQATSERDLQAISGSPLAVTEVPSAPAATEVSYAPKADSSPTLQLVEEPAAQRTDDRFPLGIFVRGPGEIASAAVIEIVGLPNEWSLSAGWPSGRGWRIPAARLSGAVLLPPRGFSGAIDLAAELRLADDTLVDRRLVRRARIDPGLGTDQAMLLLKVAEGLLDAGDISAARLVLRRAVEAGNARAALLLGETYDGCLLRRSYCSADADRAAARNWYEVANAFGSTDARERLDRLARDELRGDLPGRR
jgi:TPR repeat protein